MNLLCSHANLNNGLAGKYEHRIKAQKLRRQGFSYGEIQQQLKVSKDTISRWCKEIELSEDQKKRLINNKLLGQKKGSIIAAKNKRSLRIYRTKHIFSNSKKELGKLTKRDRFIFGIALYAGEGNKSDGKAAFVNANPAYINFMVEWFKEFCEVGREEFRGSIWLHEGNNETNAKKYWSTISGIPI